MMLQSITNNTYDGLKQDVGQDGRGHAPAQLAGVVGLAQHQGAQSGADGLQVSGLRLPGPQSRVQTITHKRQPGVHKLSGLKRKYSHVSQKMCIYLSLIHI